ncbi:Ger(x)C family spore germination C-terminal domain-containing protein [Cohnella lubricantis]|uniref:Ger(X)C family spore germination protein n=1 Tax=Cohnella lubricantis TaxID=2163172 RepID=A0A841TE12_9BACL|nr:Ger(x)C family spore germination C-terminal domain-containing protein [Cohnella lubricantis]MBB6677568.1 Ger(x)C family spore germination protein [Cohnella lubricantis]MBP2116546.1 Ger(x)C family germination protein [Cohnella lubricantis]
MFKAFVVLLICSLLAGCGMKDIDKRFYVVTTGVDWTGNPEKPFRVSLRLAITSNKVESGSSRTQIQTVEAPSIAEAVRHLKAFVDKELDFGHCRVFILGKDLVANGNPDAMSWFARRRDIQKVAFVGVGEPDALSVLKVTPESERFPGNALFLTFGNEGTESSYTVTTYLFDLTRRHFEEGMDPVLPVIRSLDKTYQIDRVLLMDKARMRLILNPDETQLYNMTANEAGKSEVKMPYRDGRIVLTVNQIRTHTDIAIGEVPLVTLKVYMSGILEESPPEALENDWNGIERQLGKRFSSEVEDLLYKIRDAGVDPYGFGLHYLATTFGNKQDFAHWKSVYPEVRFKVVTHVKITGPGVVR